LRSLFLILPEASADRSAAWNDFATGCVGKAEAETSFPHLILWRRSMKYRALVTGMAALAIGAPALADTPTALHPDPGLAAPPAAADILAQAYPAPPSYPPAPPPAYPFAAAPPAPTPPASSTAGLAPNPPPPPEAETPPPAPSPTFVWEHGHWYWNGVQYLWQPGRYIAKPTTTATYTPGHWEQRPEGWLWVGGQWSYGAQRPGG
jgi:WXXGXW repeat (2 copies)